VFFSRIFRPHLGNAIGLLLDPLGAGGWRTAAAGARPKDLLSGSWGLAPWRGASPQVLPARSFGRRRGVRTSESGSAPPSGNFGSSRISLHGTILHARRTANLSFRGSAAGAVRITRRCARPRNLLSAASWPVARPGPALSGHLAADVSARAAASGPTRSDTGFLGPATSVARAGSRVAGPRNDIRPLYLQPDRRRTEISRITSTRGRQSWQTGSLLTPLTLREIVVFQVRRYGRLPANYSSSASTWMSTPASATETGHPFLVASAMRRKVSASTPGTWARTRSFMATILK
jgi:hypothetical protein